MQFKHPEILYVLFALLIPIFIHLFQLQRFTKTPFTNIKFLKDIEFQTRKSSRLKKWLVLLARLGIFAALIIAFAQPYSSKKDTSKDWLTTIFLDNSMSMEAKGERGELLQRAVQDIAEYLPDKGDFSLLTNDQVYADLSKNILVEHLKNSVYSPTKMDLKTVLLKSQTIFDKNANKNHKLLLISDFQHNEDSKSINWNLLSNKQELDFVKVSPKTGFNTAIDSVSVLEKNADNTLLEIYLVNEGKSQKNVSVSALQNKIVLAKKTLDIPENKRQKTTLLIPNKIDNISIQIDTDDAYLFDNTFYISFQQPEIIKVLEISDNNSFLERIYSQDEFNFTQKKPTEISFELIDKQELVLLNNLEELPQHLAEKLLDFVQNGGSLTIIPNKNNTLDDLNSFFNQLNIGQLNSKLSDSLLVTKIQTSHPILRNVFDKKISNFQYPSVTTRFESTLLHTKNLLSYENQQAFISQISKGKGNIYWVSAALDLKSSNFTKAPLIVPVFYNMGKMSIRQTALAYRIGAKNRIEVDESLQQDEVLQIVGAAEDFIPIQEIQAEKVNLLTNKQPIKTGFYKIMNKEKFVKNLAFNYPKDENNLSFLEESDFYGANQNWYQYPTIKKALETLTIQQSVQSYFKWFVLLALLFLLIEILLLKYL